METMANRSKVVPRWVQRLCDLRWYEWGAWIVEIAIIGVFLLVTYDQFQEGLLRAGWVMLVIGILFAGPGLWLLLRYRPHTGSNFGKHDIGIIVAFAIWTIMLLYLLVWTVDFQPGFGNRL